MLPGKKIYFASDFHLGIPDHASSLERERKLVHWLTQIEKDVEELFLLGDLFDFWFEYSQVVPKGFIRLQGKLAELADKGIPIHIFTGNHDLWMKDYFEQEQIGKIYRKHLIRSFNGKQFYLAHGDGLGPGDRSFKLMKKVFLNPLCRRMFSWLHPGFGINLAHFFSHKSRRSTGSSDGIFLGEDKEFLVLHAREVLKTEPIDYFIFGHRHYPVHLHLNRSEFINLGDWITHFTYAVFDGETLELKHYED
ncbi:MAG: UDP-2,3-diacylglucosamine diphosphatase [Bacteroidia bacterium]